MKKVRSGLVGTGIISFHHARGWLSHPNAEIIAVCDTVEQKAQRKAKAWGVKRVYTDYKKLLKDEEIDAVDIMLPHHLHAEVAIAAAQAGKHVSVQKPMAMSSRECDTMIKAAGKAGVKLQVMENYMFYPPFEKAKELIVKGEIGKPVLIQIKSSDGFGAISKDYLDSMMKEGLMLEKWWKDKKLSGGWIFDDGVHHFAIARWLMSTDGKKRNEFDSVFAFVPDLEHERPSVISWVHRDGGLGSLNYSVADIGHRMVQAHGRYGALWEGVVVTGSKGVVWINGCTTPVIKEPSVVVYNGVEGSRKTFEDLNDDWSDSLQKNVHHFIDCILDDKEPKMTGEDGKRCAEMVFAIHKSARDERAVKVGTVNKLPF